MAGFGNKIKGPEDIRRSVHLRVMQKTSSSVYRSRLPPRSARNMKHAHAIPAVRQLNRRMKEDWEDKVAEVLRVLELHRRGRANALYSALDDTTALLNDVNKRKAEIETFAEELESSNAEMQAANEELQTVTEELERANNDLEQFAFVASHDLKEPLNTINKYANDLVQDYADTLDSDARHSLQYITQETEHMALLIDSVLLYSRVDMDTSPFQRLDIKEVVSRVVQELEAAITSSGAMVTYDDLPEILADDTQLPRVFMNVIGNAVKYTRKGRTPHIHVGVFDTGEEYMFSVRDDGIGIPREYLKDVFKMFVRLHTATEYPGAGMGLAISEKIVRRHKGRMWATSEGNGQGTTVHFSIHKGLGDEY